MNQVPVQQSICEMQKPTRVMRWRFTNYTYYRVQRESKRLGYRDQIINALLCKKNQKKTYKYSGKTGLLCFSFVWKLQLMQVVVAAAVGSPDRNWHWNPMELCQFSFTCKVNIQEYFGCSSVLRKPPIWRTARISWWSWVDANATSTTALRVSLKCKRCKPSLQGWYSAWLTITVQTVISKEKGFKLYYVAHFTLMIKVFTQSSSVCFITAVVSSHKNLNLWRKQVQPSKL